MPSLVAGGCTIEPLGERVLLLQLGAAIDPALNARVHALVAALRAAALAGVDDIVPAFSSLALHYDPSAWQGPPAPWRRFAAAVADVLQHATADLPSTASCIELPVRYGGVHGPDLDAVARHARLSPEEVVRRHAAPTYRVAMIGFAPGFPYLLGLDPALATPRLHTPRMRVPAGSVAIGGAQAGIYPSALPGGWQLIGCTPLRLFDPAREPACLLAAGDGVRFRPVDSQAFEQASPA
jgi:KipI family sensor histidine kinase inhibitor